MQFKLTAASFNIETGAVLTSTVINTNKVDRAATEPFHRTMKDEFYSEAFRKKIYNLIEELQADVNKWLRSYNEFHPHSGRHCYGKTPIQTFLDSKHIAIEKKCDMLMGKSDNSSYLTTKTVS